MVPSKDMTGEIEIEKIAAIGDIGEQKKSQAKEGDREAQVQAIVE